MRLTPLEPNIPEVGGFTDSNDLFGYREFGERFANLVCNLDQPLVVALDGPWGSGKSVFVRQWAGLLRERGNTVVTFDAFENDSHEDAFIALSAQILSAAQVSELDEAPSGRNFLQKAKKAGAALTPVAVRIAARAGTAGILSIDDIEAGGEAAKAALASLGDESQKYIEKVISEKLIQTKEERAAIEGFKEALTQLAGALSGDEETAGVASTGPLVIIVDELDRCRPPFAINVLERIKHLFSVPGVCFVLVTHLPQLEQAIQGAYGVSFNARTYLEKFYQLRLMLPDANEKIEGNVAYVSYLFRALELKFPDHHAGVSVEAQLKSYVKKHALSLRTVERIVTHVAIVCAAAGERYVFIPPIVAGLCVLRHTDPSLYEKARKQDITWDEIAGFVEIARDDYGNVDEWSIGWWKYVVEAEMPDEKLHSYAASMAKYSIDKPKSILKFMTSYIDDLVVR